MAPTHPAAATLGLTLYFIVEPPNYQYIACYLAASLRDRTVHGARRQ